MTCDFQQCGILTNVHSDEPLQPPFELKNSKWCSVSGLTIIEYSSDQQRLWSDCAYAQAGLRLCWSHIPHCWKSHALAQIQVYWLPIIWFLFLSYSLVFGDGCWHRDSILTLTVFQSRRFFTLARPYIKYMLHSLQIFRHISCMVSILKIWLDAW